MGVELVHIVDEVPTRHGSEPLPCSSVLHGFLDAGNAAALAVDHLVERGSGRPWWPPSTWTRSTTTAPAGPGISFVRDHYEDYDAPRLVVRLMRDSLERPYLLLTGPEPDTRWEGFARAVRHVVERLDVRRVVAIGLGADGGAALAADRLTQHANRTELVRRRTRGRARSGCPRAPSRCWRCASGRPATT